MTNAVMMQAMNLPERMSFFVDKLYRKIESEPEYLLETPGGPEGLTAHVVIARLYGHDDQIDHEWRIPKARHELLTPRLARPTLAISEEFTPSLRVNRYLLQSNYAHMSVSAMVLDDESLRWIGVDPGPDFLWHIAALRYRLEPAA